MPARPSNRPLPPPRLLDGLIGKTAEQRKALAKYRMGKALSVPETNAISVMTSAHQANIRKAEARALKGKG